MSDLKKRLGWKPDPPDARDMKLKAYPRFIMASLRKIPSLVSLRSEQSPVRNQVDMGSCTGYALSALREYLENIDEGSEVTKGALSPLFIYNMERMLEGTFDFDGGAYIRTGMKVLCKYGVPIEEEFPSTWDNFRVTPTPSDSSRKHAVYAYMALSGLHEIKIALSMKLPVVCGVSIYSNWELPIVEKEGLIPEPQGSFLGGHAVLIVGYNDELQTLECKNSWGVEWGDDGYFTISYAYLAHSASSFWTCLRWR